MTTERCMAKVSWNKQCTNAGDKYQTRPRTDAIVGWRWVCPEHAELLPSFMWKRPDEWESTVSS